MMMTLKIENYIFPCQAAPRPPRQGEWPGQALLDPYLPSKKPTTKAIYDLYVLIFHDLTVFLWPTYGPTKCLVYLYLAKPNPCPIWEWSDSNTCPPEIVTYCLNVY